MKSSNMPAAVLTAGAESEEFRKQALMPLAAAVVAALSPAGSAFGQDDDTVRLEEIVVTATKREMDLQDIPHNIDVVSANDIARMGARTLEDTIKALPSVNLTTTMPGRNSLVVRGISTGPFEYRTDAQVAVYLDEQPMTSNSQQVGIRNIDMNRVEQLAGPQGTLFGSSSQTGTIRYITNKPNTDAVSGNVEARYGVTSGGSPSYDVNGYANLPLVEDKVAVRVVGYRSEDGGWVDNVAGSSLSGGYDNAGLVGEDINEYGVTGGRVAALWSISDRWSLLASLVGERNEAKGTWETDPYLGDYKITRFHDEFRDDEWASGALTLQGDLGFAQLSMTGTKFGRNIAYEWDNMVYSDQKDRYWGGGLYYEQYYAGNPYYYDYNNFPLYDTEYLPSIIFNDQRQERETFEIRLTSSTESRFQWVLGAYYEDVYDEWYYGTRLDQLTSTRAWAAAQAYAYYYAPNYYNGYNGNPNQAYPLPDTDVGYSNTFQRSVKQTAFFGEASFDITNDLRILGGVRWAEFDRDSYSRFAFPEGLPPFGDRFEGDGSFRDVGTNSDTIYKVAVQYNLDEDRMVYGLFSQGFRLGGVNSLRAASTGQLPLVYEPDYLDNYEIGIKSTWLDGKLIVNADFFVMQWSNYQQGASFDLWWLRGTVNAKEAETKGFEVTADWQATDNLLLSANLFFADPEFSEDWSNNYEDGVNQPPSEDNLSIRKGMPLPNSPKRTAWASIYYDVSQPVFGGDLWFYYDISYRDETWNGLWDILNNDVNGLAPSSTYSSFSTGLQWDNGWSTDINVRNLFDERGYNYVSTSENDDADLFGDARFHNVRTLDRPRTVWLSVRKNFGGG